MRRGLRRAAAATTHRVSLVHHQAVYNQNEFWVEQVSLTRLWTTEASRAWGLDDVCIEISTIYPTLCLAIPLDETGRG